LLGLITASISTLGSSDANALQKCAQWWAQNIALFKKYEKFLIINIANEWVIRVQTIFFYAFLF
jgi:hypothetical protein